MKIYITSFNQTNDSKLLDGWSLQNFKVHGGFKYVGQFTDDINVADIVVYIREFEKNFKFDVTRAETILRNNKKIVVFDYVEYGWPTMIYYDYLNYYDFLGYRTADRFNLQWRNEYGTEYDVMLQYFEKFTEKQLIHCYFKRELSTTLNLSSVPYPVYPCDFFNHGWNDFDVKQEDVFNNKPMDCLYSWGDSSGDRIKLHGSLIYNYERFGTNIVLSQKHLTKAFEQQMKNFLFIYRAEWYDRIDYRKYIPHCKTMIDLYGAGMKCFRNLESALDSVSFKQDPSLLIHAYPWIDGKNCVYLPNKGNNKLDVDMACDIVHDCLRVNQGKLYNIYVESKKVAQLYLNENYSKNYIFPKIQSLLV